MNTLTQAQAASHAADSSDVHPSLTSALDAMRNDLALHSPDSLRLFDLFEPRLLDSVANTAAPTSPEWLAMRWKLFFVARMDEIVSGVERRLRPGRARQNQGLSVREGVPLHNELLSAFAAHFAGKHRKTLAWLADFARTWGAATIAALIFMLGSVISFDLTGRAIAFFHG